MLTWDRMTNPPFTIAHLSDVHLTRVENFTPHFWSIKRISGFANWHRTRKHVHQPQVLDELVSDMRGTTADHIAVTGDLVNIGLPSEYNQARTWLERLGNPDMVSVVPGNHDIYVPIAPEKGVGLWQDYMTSAPPSPPVMGDGAEGYNRLKMPGRHEGWTAKTFPFVRRLRHVALIGLNSAVPTPPFVAAGTLGHTQLEALRRTLRELKPEGLARVVLIHHPPLPGQAPRMRALRDAAALQAVLQAEGATLVLHGHNHANTIVRLPTVDGPLPIVGIASGSAAKSHKGEALGRYNLITIAGEPGSWRLELKGRGFSAEASKPHELETCRLA